MNVNFEILRVDWDQKTYFEISAVWDELCPSDTES